MNILRVILATLFIFGTGALSGYFVAKKQIAIDPALAVDRPGATNREGLRSMDRGRRSMMDRMQRDLDLSDEQREAISEIFAKSRERSRELWKQMREPMNLEVKRVQEEVKTILTPEQARKFDEINKRRHEQYRNKNRETGNPTDNVDPEAGQHCSVNRLRLRQTVL